MSDVDEKLFAIADMLRAIIRDEGGQHYEIELFEMYIIIDGVGSIKQEIANQSVELCRAATQLAANAATIAGLKKRLAWHEEPGLCGCDGHEKQFLYTGDDDLTVCLLCKIDAINAQLFAKGATIAGLRKRLAIAEDDRDSFEDCWEAAKEEVSDKDAEIAELEARVAELEACKVLSDKRDEVLGVLCKQLEVAEDDRDAARAQLAEHALLVAEVERLRGALEQYADAEDWGSEDAGGCFSMDDVGDVCRVGPEVARQALAAIADSSTCPTCSGPADRGHDREDPPNAFECSKCDPNERRPSMTSDLYRFVVESNRIEGIDRTTTEQVAAHRKLVALPNIDISNLEEFVHVCQPGARLRDKPGLNVRVGKHFAPPGGPDIRDELVSLLSMEDEDATSYSIHREYETLHPFTDCNGRSGRALWLWMMFADHGRVPPLGFLHTWYYQSLEGERR